MQAAFQQLMQSPSQVQRLMQLLSSNPTNAPAPISTPMTGPTQSGSWTPPTALDLPQLTQLALYDNNTAGGGGNNVLTFDSNKDVVGPSATQLAEDDARLALTYQDAGEVDADVDVLQANINALIENMGFDSEALSATTAPSATSIHPQPPLPLSEEGLLPPQTPTDFDFESFFTAFTDTQDSEVGATDVDVDAVVGRISSVPGSTASVSDSTFGAETDSIKESTVQSTVGRKRTSDVAELGPPLREPPKSMLSSHVMPATRTDAPTGNPPRAKRNKK